MIAKDLEIGKVEMVVSILYIERPREPEKG